MTKANGRTPSGFLRALSATMEEVLASKRKPEPFHPSQLLRRIVAVDSYTDNKGRLQRCIPPRHGVVYAVEPDVSVPGQEYLLRIRLSMGVAVQDIGITKRFSDTTWRLAFPREGER